MAKTDDTLNKEPKLAGKRVNAAAEKSPKKQKMKVTEGKHDKSKNQVTTFLSDLHQFDAHFQDIPQHVVKGGLNNMSPSEWAKLQKKWEDLQLARCELELKRSKLVVYSTKLLLKAATSASAATSES